MANVNDVHDMAGQVERERARLNDPDHDSYVAAIDERDRQAIIEFANHRDVNAGVKPSTLRDNISNVRRLAERSDMPLVDFESIKDATRLIQRNKSEYDLSENTTSKYRREMRIFYRWLHEDADYGDFEWWVDIDIPSNETEPIDPDEVLDVDDVAALRSAADHPREKALVEFLADTGMRIAAALQIRRGGVTGLDGPHPTFKPNSDGESQKGITTLPLPIIQSQRYLAVWLNQYHPEDHPKAPVFTVRDYHERPREDGAVSPSRMSDKLKSLAEAADVDPDKVHAHAFRHVATTRMRRDMNMDWDDIAHRTGWSDNTIAQMKQIYSHLTHEDRNKRVFNSAGRETGDSDEEDGPTFVTCTNCAREIPADARYCPDCGADQEAEYVEGEVRRALAQLDGETATMLVKAIDNIDSDPERREGLRETRN